MAPGRRRKRAPRRGSQLPRKRRELNNWVTNGCATPGNEARAEPLERALPSSEDTFLQLASDAEWDNVDHDLEDSTPSNTAGGERTEACGTLREDCDQVTPPTVEEGDENNRGGDVPVTEGAGVVDSNSNEDTGNEVGVCMESSLSRRVRSLNSSELSLLRNLVSESEEGHILLETLSSSCSREEGVVGTGAPGGLSSMMGSENRNEGSDESCV